MLGVFRAVRCRSRWRADGPGDLDNELQQNAAGHNLRMKLSVGLGSKKKVSLVHSTWTRI